MTIVAKFSVANEILAKVNFDCIINSISNANKFATNLDKQINFIQSETSLKPPAWETIHNQNTNVLSTRYFDEALSDKKRPM